MSRRPKSLTRESCGGFQPRMFVVNHANGEKLRPEVARLLDPVDSSSYHFWELSKEKATKLHYHDCDEYWAWVKGRTLLTLRLPDGRRDEFEIGPGWTVYCVRGVEHGHEPLGDWASFEWRSVPREGARLGHLLRELF